MKLTRSKAISKQKKEPPKGDSGVIDRQIKLRLDYTTI